MRDTMNKKGISTVVSTIIIIGISIAAISILAPIILNALKGPMLSPAVSCSEIRTLIPVKIKDICYNNASEIRIKLERTFDNLDIPSLTFSLDNNGKTRKWACGLGCRNCEPLSSGETKYYYLSVNEPLNNAALTLFAGDCVLEREEITAQCTG